MDSSLCRKTWAEAAGLPEVRARLALLPEGVDFPDGFPEPIRFDPRHGRLAYRGAMSVGSYLYLRGLSEDPAYLSAVDALFRHGSCLRAVAAWTMTC